MLCTDFHSFIQKIRSIGSSIEKKNKKRSINKRIYTKRKRDIKIKLLCLFFVTFLTIENKKKGSALCVYVCIK